MSDTVTGNTYKYGYDSSGRLTSVAVTGRTDPRTYTYVYDAAGNRTSAVVTGASPSTQSNTFNNTDPAGANLALDIFGAGLAVFGASVAVASEFVAVPAELTAAATGAAVVGAAIGLDAVACDVGSGVECD